MATIVSRQTFDADPFPQLSHTIGDSTFTHDSLQFATFARSHQKFTHWLADLEIAHSGKQSIPCQFVDLCLINFLPVKGQCPFSDVERLRSQCSGLATT